jgi:hypothetical protein
MKADAGATTRLTDRTRDAVIERITGVLAVG